MKNTKKYFKLTFTSILIALIFVLSWTVLGMVPLVIASATTIFIPVAIGIVCLNDYRCTIILGLAFGLSSFIRALSPQSVIDPFFINPLVSILPRLCAALLTHFCFRLLSKGIKSQTLLSGIVGGLMALFNTLFTIPMLILCNFNNESFLSTISELNFTIPTLISTTLLMNMIPEIIVGVIITFVVYKTFSLVFLRED